MKSKSSFLLKSLEILSHCTPATYYFVFTIKRNYNSHNTRDCNYSRTVLVLSRNHVTLQRHRFVMHFNEFQFSASAATRKKRNELKYFLCLFSLPPTKRPRDATGCVHAVVSTKSRPKMKKDIFCGPRFSGNLTKKFFALAAKALSRKIRAF